MKGLTSLQNGVAHKITETHKITQNNRVTAHYKSLHVYILQLMSCDERSSSEKYIYLLKSRQHLHFVSHQCSGSQSSD